jgi:purine-binding chemotaxis protein CheW
VAAELPDAPDAPKAIDTPAAPVAPHRISSPVEVATTLRLTPPLGLTTVTAFPAAVAAVPDARPLVPGPQPAAEDPAAATTVEDYATSLMRRLAAMAPAEIDDAEQLDADRRPLRERVRDRAGLADLLMFRIGEELFATDLSAVEEAVTLPEIHHLPEMPAAMLGAFNLRGRLTPVYSPSQVIGVPLRGQAQAALLVRSGNRRLGLAVDDVEDVFQVNLANVREAPGTDDTDGILLGVAHHGTELVAIVDAEALVAACVTGHAMEIPA